MDIVAKILGAIVLVALVVMIATFGYEEYWGASLDESSRAYVNEVVPVIVSNWSSDEILKRAAPQFTAATNLEQLRQFLESRSRLGSLERYNGAEGHALISFSLREGKIVTANYTAPAKFRRGRANISIRLIMVNNEWKILSFYVDPPAFDK